MDALILLFLLGWPFAGSAFFFWGAFLEDVGDYGYLAGRRVERFCGWFCRKTAELWMPLAVCIVLWPFPVAIAIIELAVEFREGVKDEKRSSDGL